MGGEHPGLNSRSARWPDGSACSASSAGRWLVRSSGDGLYGGELRAGEGQGLEAFAGSLGEGGHAAESEEVNQQR
jgi:hypothetical protein